MTDVRCGVAFPTGMEGLMYPVPFGEPDDLIGIATLAEDLGYDSIGGNDHIVVQDYVREEWQESPRYYDVFTTYAHVAAETEHLKLNTAVTVLPLRDPVWVAKQAMTLDVLSDGRLILGTGVGAYREEFEAIHSDVALPRGLAMDESMEALSDLLAGERASYDGEYVQFEDVELRPHTVQNPLPVYVGGNHPNALERAVKWGHGWLPAGITPDELAERTDRLEALCEEHDRDPDDIDVAPQLIAGVSTDEATAHERFRESQVFEHLKSLTGSTLKDQDLDDVVDQNLIGSPDQLIEKLEAYVEVGVTHFPAIIFAANDVPELERSMGVFADEVMGSF